MSEILWLSWLPASLMTIQSKMRALLRPQHFLHYNKSMGNIFGAQGQVTLKLIVQSGPKFNLYKILCLSSLSASLKSKKISNDQELIQSDPTSCPQNQKGNN